MNDEIAITQDAKISVPNLDVNIGTEDIKSEDVNTPYLKIVQPNSQDIENKVEGSFYRSDTKMQYSDVSVNLVYVTSSEVENYNKTGNEKIKIYYGFYAETNEPFKMFMRGWGLDSHRDFQTEVLSLKNKYKAPMLLLTVILTTVKQSGIIKDTGKPYTIFKPVFTILKNLDGSPIFEENKDRIDFLVNSVNKFKSLSNFTTENDDSQNQVNVDDLPF